MGQTDVRYFSGEGETADVHTQDVHMARVIDLKTLSKEERIAVLRQTMQQVTQPVSDCSKNVDPGHTVLKVPEGLAQLLPQHGLSRATVYEYDATALLAVEIIAEVSNNGTVAIIGWEDLCLSGVIEAGGCLENIVVIPDPDGRPLQIASLLFGGIDLIICCALGTLSPSESRPLLAKLRSSNSCLLLVGASLPSAIRIYARARAFTGIGEGVGRIREILLDTEVTVKGQRHKGILAIGSTRASIELPVQVANTG